MTQEIGRKIDHALFGYAEGHRQLASTLRLPSRDMYHLGAASDLAGDARLEPRQSYLTGLPLSESRRYALIRTWSAPEMPRPGCVWSHVLLLDQEVVSTQPDMSIFLTLFRDPRQVDRGFYSETLSLEADASSSIVEPNPNLVAEIVSSYYSHRVTHLDAGAGAELIESAVAAVWSQQWPRLRMEFSFRTAQSRRRSKARYDVQVLVGGKADAFPRAGWIDAAVEDAASNNVTPLRRFLWRYGRDVRDPRDRFQLLVETQLAATAVEHLSMTAAAKVFEELEADDDGAILKKDILGLSTTPLSICPPVAFLDMLRLLDMKGTDAKFDVGEIERRFTEISNLEAAAVADFASAPDNRLVLLREPILDWTVARADDEIVDALETADVRLRILLMRPDLVTDRSLADLSGDDLARLFEACGTTETSKTVIDAAVRRDFGRTSVDIVLRAPEFVAASVIAAAREGALHETWHRPIANARDMFLDTDLLRHAESLSDVKMIARLVGLGDGVFAVGRSAANWTSRWSSLRRDVVEQDVLDIEADLLRGALQETSSAGWDLIAAILPELRGLINGRPIGGEARRILDRSLPDLGYDNWDLNRRILLALHLLHARIHSTRVSLSRAGLSEAEANFVRKGPQEEPRKKVGFFWWLG